MAPKAGGELHPLRHKYAQINNLNDNSDPTYKPTPYRKKV